MLGNVFEWVQDRYGDYPGGRVTDPQGPSAGEHRVYRGCSWSSGGPYDTDCRPSPRLAWYGYIGPDQSGWHVGFRLLRAE